MLDLLDQQIIRATQSGLPLTTFPYHQLAEQLGIEVDELIQRMQQMQANGLIRRIAAVPNHYRLGYRYNGMSVWDIDDQWIDELGTQVAQLAFVSHCYQRPRHLPEWRYNLFAMIHAKTEIVIQQQLKIIQQIVAQHCQDYTVLYSQRILKKTGLRI
ncbi:MAG: hypothetical protein RL637_854 [Pseudomonadota bacterium]|jgi:DNA-binding Lrp family transcriptional regulator